MKPTFLGLACAAAIACQTREAKHDATPEPPEAPPQTSSSTVEPSRQAASRGASTNSEKEAPSPAPEAEPPARMLTPPKPLANGRDLFGAELSNARKVPLAELLSKPQSFEGATVRIDGTARRVCSRKGCWMELAASNADDAPSCRVKFAFYAFFVPTDSAGSTVTVEGVPQITTVKPGRVRHLEREGARFASKNADGSANEVQLIATGVEMQRN